MRIKMKTGMQWMTVLFPILLSAQSPEMEMVWVEGGTFTMGCTEEQEATGFCDDSSDEWPPHQVNLSSFYIGKYEVTQGQWQEVMGDNPSFFGGCGLQCPVESVNWYSMIVFCNKLSERHGYEPCYYKDMGYQNEWGTSDYGGAGLASAGHVHWNRTANGYHLPTEAQWEYAARGGMWSRGYVYSGGDDLEQVGWYKENSQDSPGSPRTDTKGIHPKGQKRPNELGLYDMSGNVLECCWDDFTSNYGFGDAVCQPISSPGGIWEVHHNPASSCCPVVRGGAWSGGFARLCRVSDRNAASAPNARSDDNARGFRVFRY